MEYFNANGIIQKMIKPFKDSYSIFQNRRPYDSFTDTIGEIFGGPLRFYPFFLLGFGIAFFECFCSRRLNLFTKLTNKFTTIDGNYYEPSAMEDYVYYHTDNIKYPDIKDPLFGFSHQCGLLERKVQYCQWIQVSHTKSRKVGNSTITKRYYTYHKQWLHHQVSSLFYRDPLYWNPTVDYIPEASLRGDDLNSNIQAGAYSISTNMSLIGNKIYYYPESYQIREFEERGLMPEFKYVGKGVFYSSYKRGILDQLLRVAQFFDLKGDVVDWCTPGDRRIWFESWEPTDVTVVGLHSEKVIRPFNYLSYKIGSLHSGEVSLLKAALGNASSFPTVMKWLLRIAAVAYFGLSFYYSEPDLSFVEACVAVVLFGVFIPARINCNVLMNVVLAVVGGLYLFEMKELDFSVFRFARSGKEKID